MTELLDSRFDEFSNYLQEELKRLDEEISEEVDNRVQAAFDSVPDLLSAKMEQFEQGVKALVDAKIKESNDLFGGFPEELGGVMQPDAAQRRSHSPSQGPSADQYQAGSAAGASAAGGRQNGSGAGDSLIDDGASLAGSSAAGRAGVVGQDESAADIHSATSEAGPHESPSGRPELHHSHRAAPDPEVMKAIRSIHHDVKTRLPQVEEALAELKPLRLQMPALQQDLENLSASVAQLAQIIEEDDKTTDEGDRQGSRQFTPLQPIPAIETDDLDQVAEADQDAFDEQGATAGAHSPDQGFEAPRARPSMPAQNMPDVKARRASVMNQGKLGSLVSHYMHPGAQANPADRQDLDKLKMRTTKLEEDSRKIDKISDLEQLVLILEDRVKELDAEHRSHAKVVDIKLGLLAADVEKEDQQAKKVYSSWNLADQVDVILSVVAQEMRSLRMDMDSQVKILLAREAVTPSPPLPRQSIAPGRMETVQQQRASPTKHDRSSPRSRSNSPERDVKEVEEKVKRLQECYQQCTLKIAGLKSANRHSEQQVSMALDQMKKMSSEMEQLYDTVLRQECRLDYMIVDRRVSSPGNSRGPSPTFKDAVNRAPSSSPDQQKRGSTAGLMIPVASSHTPPPVMKPRGAVSGQDAFLAGSASPRRGEEAPRLSSARPRRMSSGAVAKDAVQPGTQAAPTESKQVSSEQDDINTGRIWRLGKKINDIHAEMHQQNRSLREELELAGQKITMMITFLPRKQRRMVERLLTTHKHDEKDEDVQEKKEESRRRVSFSEKPADVRTFNVEHDSHQVPWQVVGEPDPKWHWCLQPRNEMGRDLARYFEQLEHERDELAETLGTKVEMLEDKMTTQMELVRYRSNPLQRQVRGGADSETLSPFSSNANRGPSPISPRDIPPRTSWDTSKDEPPLSAGQITAGGAEALTLSRRLEKVLIPQLGVLEDRVERLAKDMSDCKKSLDLEEKKKVDKEEFQLIAMRLSVFEKFDPKQVATQIENLEVDGKHYMHLIGQLGEQIRKVEGYAAHRADVTKVRAEVSTLKMDLQKTQADLKETASTVFHGNRQVSTMVIEAKTALEKNISRLELEKVQITDYAVMYEKVLKLESSMRDNRQILSDHGGQELSSVVKRIILNMEDKIMVLEKKVDCLADGRPFDSIEGVAAVPQSQARASPIGQPASAENEAIVQNLSSEISTLMSTMTQLKQDVNMSKVTMENIQEQGHQNLELAHRLQISVDTGGEGEEGTTLSLSRVQVMVAAAARQLVAGSKWITKEMFDLRVTEMRREYLAGFRQLQTVVEDMQGTVKVMGAGRKLPAVGHADKAALQLMRRGGDQEEMLDWPGGGFDWDKAGGRHIVSTKDQRPATSGLASLPASRGLPRPPNSARTHDRR